MRLGTLEIASEAAYSLYTPFPIRCNNTITSHVTLDYPSTTFDNPRRTVDFFHKLFSSLLTPPCRSISGHSSINLSTLSKPRVRLGFLPPSALESALAWSFNRDGEAMPGLVEKRDRTLGTDTTQTRRGREDLQPLAKPQSGVDVLKGKFGRDTRDIPGVVDVEAGKGAGAR